MGLLDSFRNTPTKIERQEPTLIIDRPRNHSQKIKTAWDGAKVDNLVAGWVQSSVPINQQIERELRTLRSRSRQLAKNDPYVKRFLQLARINVVGPTGFTFRSTASLVNGKENKPARDAITHAWKRAMRPGVLCARDKYSGLDFFNLSSDQLYRDGEIVITAHTGKAQGEFGIKFAFVDPELLDVNHRAVLRNGNRVRMGLETDKKSKVVAYHFHSTDTTHSNYYAQDGRGYLRIAAEFVMHIFRTEYVDQLRGYPHTAAAMLRLRMLNGYEEAELVGSRAGAATMGFIVPGENGKGFEGESTIVQTDEWGESIVDSKTQGTSETIEAEAGTFHYLDAGADVKMFDPNHPNGAYAAFIKAVLRGIASGLGINYNTLANDLEGVNFSSMRSGVLEDREAWKANQEFLIEHLITPLFERWLSAALLSGAIKLPRGLRLPVGDIERLSEHVFQGRRWSWVDPLKDAQANKLAVDERFRSRSSVIRETGSDPLEVWDEIELENKVLDKKDIKPVSAEAPVIADDSEDDNADQSKPDDSGEGDDNE